MRPGIAAGVLVLGMGIVVSLQVVGPLALVASAFPAALGAAWVGKLFAEDRRPLLLVVAVAEAAAVVTFLAMLAAALLPGLRSYLRFAPLALTVVLRAGVIVAGACAVRGDGSGGTAPGRCRGIPNMLFKLCGVFGGKGAR